MTEIQTCDKCGMKEGFELGARVERFIVLMCRYDLCNPCYFEMQEHIMTFFDGKKNEGTRSATR